MDRTKSQLNNFLKKNWFVLVLVLTFFLRLPSLFEPFTYGDEGVYLTLGQAVRKGLVLYRDIHDNKPPLIYLLAAVAGNFSYFRLLLFGWMIVTIVFFRKLAERLFPKNKNGIIVSTFIFAVLSSVHTFEGNVANAENFMMLPTILGFMTFFPRYARGFTSKRECRNSVQFISKLKLGAFLNTVIIFLKAKTQQQYFLSGVFLSLAVLFKFPAVFDFAAIVVFAATTVKTSLKKLSGDFIHNLMFLLLGFILPIFTTIVFFALQNALGQYLKAAFLQNLPYLSSWTADKPKVFSLPLGLLSRAFFVFLVSYLIFAFRNRLPREIKLIVVWFAFTLFGSLLSSRPYPHYLLQTIPALSLSLALLFSKKRIVPILLIFIFMAAFLGFKFWHYENISYYQNFYRFALGQKTKEQYFDYFGDSAQSLYKAASHIKARSSSNERIFIWGNQPSLYGLTERLPVGRYTVAYHIVDFNGFRETIQALEKDPPRFIIITGDETRDFPAFFAFVHNNYLTELQIKNLRILRRTIQAP